jgi:putative membrane protein
MRFDKNFLKTKAGKAIYVGAVTVALSAVGSWAVLAHQDGPAMKQNTTMAAKPSMADTHFAKEAAQGGMAEVKLGQLAQDQGSSDAVKAFGKRMVDDHSAAGDKLKTVASGENITLPTDISAKDQLIYDRLSKLRGAAFDRAYAKDMVKDHQDDIAAFRKEATNGRDASLKTFASETLPTLQEHLTQANEMAKSVGVGSATSKTSGR